MAVSAARHRRGDGWVAIWFLLPNLLGFLIFTFLPVFASLLLAFLKWDIISPPRWAGLSNFRQLLGERLMWKYAWNTVFLMFAIPVNMAASLGLAVLLSKKLRGTVFFRTIFFLPSIAAGVAIYILWSWIYNPEFGLINSLLRRIGINGPQWLDDVHLAKPSLMLMGLWASAGGMNMILYLAGLSNVPPELLEAAEIDGATGWQRFRHVTWPLLSPTTFFIFIMSVIGGFQGGFQQAYIMTRGGPAGATTTIMYYIFNNAFVWLKMGKAAALAWMMFVVIFAVTLINWKHGGKRVHY